MPVKAAVLGAGSWGTALASLLAGNGHETVLWSRGKEVAAAVNARHENPVYLPGLKLNEDLKATSDAEQALAGARLVVAVVPSHAMRETMTAVAPWIEDDAVVVSASKGIEDESCATMTAVIGECLAAQRQGDSSTVMPRVGVLSGPSFATEVAAGMPTVVVAAAADQETAEGIQHNFASLNLRVYSSTDVTGVEVGGVVKNVIAIATGVGDGLGLGHNARAATITRALAETQRLAAALGARPETLWGLSGLGDLVLTCTGDLSRNRQFGLRIGRGEDVEQILGSMRMVVEGVRNTRSVKMLADRHGVEMPIVETCYEVLYNGMAPPQALSELLGRSLKPEFH